MDSVFAWAVLTILGIVGIYKVLSSMPNEYKKDVYTSMEMKYITGRKK